MHNVTFASLIGVSPWFSRFQSPTPFVLRFGDPVVFKPPSADKSLSFPGVEGVLIDTVNDTLDDTLCEVLYYPPETERWTVCKLHPIVPKPVRREVEEAWLGRAARCTGRGNGVRVGGGTVIEDGEKNKYGCNYYEDMDYKFEKIPEPMVPLVSVEEVFSSRPVRSALAEIDGVLQPVQLISKMGKKSAEVALMRMDPLGTWRPSKICRVEKAKIVRLFTMMDGDSLRILPDFPDKKPKELSKFTDEQYKIVKKKRKELKEGEIYITDKALYGGPGSARIFSTKAKTEVKELGFEEIDESIHVRRETNTNEVNAVIYHHVDDFEGGAMDIEEIFSKYRHRLSLGSLVRVVTGEVAKFVGIEQMRQGKKMFLSQASFLNSLYVDDLLPEKKLVVREEDMKVPEDDMIDLFLKPHYQFLISILRLESDNEWNLVACGSKKTKQKFISSTSYEMVSMVDGVKAAYKTRDIAFHLFGKLPRVIVVMDSKPLYDQIEFGLAHSELCMQGTLDYLMQEIEGEGLDA
uniref:Uncharacterized protein n=2 Tax=Chromera velia CCMP2878 TaxID=1169474 RepID=A0A0K6S7Y5_9ALVE|eukprot:Cvel_22881.t1-p1 / transcript=Cvel_22881.t1 / gene=Cvel_22881 / organism=Chromera_velia_CCMP2878 / gene_product=hypothetical protein / transcript_product=hypothetical protein / location=Cvel_scaffold2298:8097-11463(-) / protein_length=519 / sequence_SO=supercontig / SO=protein_coding / is_pseudo=false